MQKEKSTKKASPQWVQLGQFLARQRELLGESMIKMGKNLGHANGNFIGVIEKGQEKIPKREIASYAIAYNCNISLLHSLYLKCYAPEFWNHVVLEAIKNTSDEKAAQLYDQKMQAILSG